MVIKMVRVKWCEICIVICVIYRVRFEYNGVKKYKGYV